MRKLRGIVVMSAIIGVTFAIPFAVCRVSNAGTSEQGQDTAPTVVVVKHNSATPPASDCCPKYCLTYYHHSTLLRTCCGRCKPLQILLDVKDPCYCECVVQVPVCIPRCCTGEPTVHSRGGIFVRGVVTYRWCCGYKIRVVFTKCDEVLVHSYGR